MLVSNILLLRLEVYRTDNLLADGASTYMAVWTVTRVALSGFMPQITNEVRLLVLALIMQYLNLESSP